MCCRPAISCETRSSSRPTDWTKNVSLYRFRAVLLVTLNDLDRQGRHDMVARDDHWYNAFFLPIQDVVLKPNVLDTSLFPAELSTIKAGAKGSRVASRRHLDHFKSLEGDEEERPQEGTRDAGQGEEEDEAEEEAGNEEEEYDEEDNDYIESYFDNGEGEHEDGGEDDRGMSF